MTTETFTFIAVVGLLAVVFVILFLLATYCAAFGFVLCLIFLAIAISFVSGISVVNELQTCSTDVTNTCDSPSTPPSGFLNRFSNSLCYQSYFQTNIRSLSYARWVSLL